MARPIHKHNVHDYREPYIDDIFDVFIYIVRGSMHLLRCGSCRLAWAGAVQYDFQACRPQSKFHIRTHTYAVDPHSGSTFSHRGVMIMCQQMIPPRASTWPHIFCALKSLVRGLSCSSSGCDPACPPHVISWHISVQQDLQCLLDV